ncbi:unnamed protein product [Lampetra planeri]
MLRQCCPDCNSLLAAFSSHGSRDRAHGSVVPGALVPHSTARAAPLPPLLLLPPLPPPLLPPLLLPLLLPAPPARAAPRVAGWAAAAAAPARSTGLRRRLRFTLGGDAIVNQPGEPGTFAAATSSLGVKRKAERGACVRLCSRVEIGDIAGVADVTIRQSYRLIYPKASQLFPQDFKFDTPVEKLPQL